MTRSSTALFFLRMNSLFSALNGVVLLLAAGLVAPILFADPIDWAAMGLRGLGIGLLGFAGMLFLLSKNRYISRAAVNEIVLLDALWVFASVVVIAFFGEVFTRTGISIVTLVAMVVAFFAITQFASAAKILAPVPIAQVTQKKDTFTQASAAR